MKSPLLAAIAALPLAALPAAAQSGGEVDLILHEMATWVEPCVQPTTTQRVFTGCLDTHSSIHAHWAAYRIARALPERMDLALTSELALEYDKLRYEATYMGYPYAIAWFLRLAVEYEQWSRENDRPDPERMRPVADALASVLLNQLQAQPIDPTIGEYANPSWHLVQLHAYYESIGAEHERALVGDLIDLELVRPIRGASFHTDLDSDEFFSKYGNWTYAVLKTRSAETVDDFLAMQAAVPDSHLRVNEIGTAHSYGMGWSRTWALVALSRSHPDPAERSRFRRAVHLHIEAGMKRHDFLQGNFVNYDHWVPQFIVYAVTEGLELPVLR